MYHVCINDTNASPVVDMEKIKPVDCLGYCFIFPSMLSYCWLSVMESIWLVKNHCHLTPKEQINRKKTKGKWLTMENGH